MRNSKSVVLVLLTVLFIVVLSCRKETWNTDPNFKLEFSNDTILFDTVFTTIGSTKRQITIYNKSNEPVKIQSVMLSGGAGSSFSLNVDGVSGHAFKDIEIGAKDSIFIFAKVTINPNNQDLPLIITDSVNLLINNNMQSIKLVAWGQDAYFYNNFIIKGNLELKPNKPHVFYGSLTLDTLANLTIPAGTQLCFHYGAKFICCTGSKIISNGTLNNPVVFRGDKYGNYKPNIDTISGQWKGVYMEKGSGPHKFNFTHIKNSYIGLYIDSIANSNPTLTLHNCIISNTTEYGVLSNNSSIIAGNTEFSNCGGYLLALYGGDKYDFRNCTFANYWKYEGRKTSSVMISNKKRGNEGYVNSFLNNTFFGNCIIMGSRMEEIAFLKDDATPFDLKFRNSLLKTTLNEAKSDIFVDCIFNEDAKFVNTEKSNFQLDSLSKAIDIGSLQIINESELDISKDMLGNSRQMHGNPDAGCYEKID